MKSLIALFAIVSSYLCADMAVVKDYPTDILWGDVAKYPKDGEGLVGWAYVNYRLMKRGEQLFYTNLEDNELSRLQDPSTSVIIFNNLPLWIRSDWREFLAKIPARKMLICWEPPVVMPELYQKEILDLFDVVLTWNSDLVDNKKFFQFYCPSLLMGNPKTLPFDERRVLTQISPNKRSNNPFELYSLRRKAIRYFERHPRKDFCFYGYMWKRNCFHTYGGAIKDKLSYLERYRFCLCFEDMKHIRGYVTEKIFECFHAGCVPVYYGASDIGKLIPKKCYIRWQDFKSFKKLYAYLKKMPKETYLRYVNNAQKFVASKRGKLFKKETFGKMLLKAIVQAKISKKKHYVLKK